MDLHFASVWEAVADTVPDEVAVVAGDRRLRYRDYDDQAARFAAALAAVGLGEGSKIALYLHNDPEYLVAQYGAFKLRAAAVNVNYRYRDAELVSLIDDSDSEVLVYNSSLGDRVAAARDRLASVRVLVEVDDGNPHLDGAIAFGDFVAGHAPMPRIDRLRGDLYMLYTGGTTGLPKGVMYGQGDFVAALYSTMSLDPGAPVPASVGEVPAAVRWYGGDRRLVSIPCPPLMHGTGMWVGAMRALLTGGTVVLLRDRTFDPHEVWRLTATEGVTHVVIVGDAFARPLLRALEEAEAAGRPYDVRTVTNIISSGAMWSAEVKDGLTSRLDAVLTDALGSTEGGGYGVSVAQRGTTVATARFALAPGTRVLDEYDHDVVQGSGDLGLLATPTPAYAYYKDRDKSARTFRRIDGTSYVMTGDWATVLEDGTITLLGRGSNCINSGGEKVFPEEVEEAIKRHAGIDDCLVVGLPDDRLGEQVVAVAGGVPGRSPDGEELRTWLRSQLAGFKVPRRVVVVDAVRRAPNGKADYRWAREVALAAASPEGGAGGADPRPAATARPTRPA